MRRNFESVLWFVVAITLILAAMTSARIPLAVLGILAVGAIAVVIPLHFFHAWRKLGAAPNKREYALWVGLETLFAIGLLAGFVSCVWLR